MYLYYTDEFKRDAKKLDGQTQARLKKVIGKILQAPTRFTARPANKTTK